MQPLQFIILVWVILPALSILHSCAAVREFEGKGKNSEPGASSCNRKDDGENVSRANSSYYDEAEKAWSTGYRGCAQRTVTGAPCANWAEVDELLGIAVGDHAYCRNPDLRAIGYNGPRPTLWCYTSFEGSSWKFSYCRVRKLRFLAPKEAHVIYQFLYDFTRLLEKNRMQYFVTFGTLLGAVRSGGLVPWDDDLDIAMDASDRVLVYSQPFQSQMWELGYALVPAQVTGSKRFDAELNRMKVVVGCFDKDGVSMGGTSMGSGLMDIFWIDMDTGETNNGFEKIPLADLYPLRNYRFGDYTVTGMNRPDAYLDKSYDSGDWRGSRPAAWNHTDDFFGEIALSEDELRPAQALRATNKTLRRRCDVDGQGPHGGEAYSVQYTSVEGKSVFAGLTRMPTAPAAPPSTEQRHHLRQSLQ